MLIEVIWKHHRLVRCCAASLPILCQTMLVSMSPCLLVPMLLARQLSTLSMPLHCILHCLFSRCPLFFLSDKSPAISNSQSIKPSSTIQPPIPTACNTGTVAALVSYMPLILRSLHCAEHQLQLCVQQQVDILSCQLVHRPWMQRFHGSSQSLLPHSSCKSFDCFPLL